MQDAEPRAGGSESRALTGLRGGAAMLVVAHHLYLHFGLDQGLPGVQWALRRGYLGVDLFFVLSGFVLSMNYGRWFDGSRAWSLHDLLLFLSRRVARLWPLHALMIALVLLLGRVPEHMIVTWRLVLANLAMIQAWGISTELNPPAWSVSTEFLAYLAFPVLVWMASRGRVGLVVCALGAVAAIGACVAFAPGVGLARRGLLDVYFNYSVLPALRCLGGFVFGMLAWRAGLGAAVARVAGHWAVGPVALVVMLGLMMGRVSDLVIYPVLPVVVLGMHYGRGAMVRVLASGMLHRLGLLSYAVYLVHVVVLGLFPFERGPAGLMVLAYLAAVVGCAAAAYAVVEEPGRRLIRAGAEVVLRRPLRPGVH